VSVFLENLTAISSVLVAVRLGKHLEVVSLEVALVVDLTLFDEAHIDVGARAEIVVDTSLDSLDYESLGLILRHTLPVTSLKHGHSRKRTRSHGEERSRLVVTIR